MTPFFSLSISTGAEYGTRERFLHKHQKIETVLLTATVFIAVFLLLYLGRAYDDNHLTSWETVFQQISAMKVLAILIGGLACAALVPMTQHAALRSPVFLFLLSFIAGSFFWKEPEVIVDTARYFTQAKYLELYGIGHFLKEWGREIHAWTDMPLIPFLHGVLFRTAGEHRVVIQVFTTGLFAMTVVLTYLAGRRLWDEWTGFLGGYLMLGIPYLYTQVPLMLVDVPSMFFLMLSIYTLLRALDDGGFWIGGSSLSIVLTVFSKYSSLLMLTIIPVIFGVYLLEIISGKRHDLGDAEKDRQSVMRRTIYRFAALVLLSSAAVILILLSRQDVLREQMELLLTYQKPGLKRWSESFRSTFLFQVHPVITAAAIFSVFTALKRRDVRYIIIIWLVALVVALQVRRIRYLVMVFPMLSLMASYGFSVVKSRFTAGYAATCTVVSSLVFALFAFLPFLQKTSPVNLQEAGVFLDTLDVRNVSVYAFAARESEINPAVAVPVLDYFTMKHIVFAEHEEIQPPAGQIETSSLRFTWEYRVPSYYKNSGEREEAQAIAVIYGDRDHELPEDIRKKARVFRKKRSFALRDDYYQNQSLVDVYYD